MNTLATLLIIMYVTVLIGICFIVKRLNTIEEKMVEIHNHLVDGLDHFMMKEANHHSDTIEALDHLNDMLQSAQDSRNVIHMKLDNLQENWSDLKTGSIQVLTVK